MAIHETCPPTATPNDHEMIAGTALSGAVRCKAQLCQGSGETRGSAYKRCEGCSEYYGICEKCAREFTLEFPKQGCNIAWKRILFFAIAICILIGGATIIMILPAEHFSFAPLILIGGAFAAGFFLILAAHGLGEYKDSAK